MKAFDSNKYLKLQSEKILERVNFFGDKLYLEFGGKLFDDFHASRVLPGFLPDIKLQMLLKLKKDVEVIIVINALDIEKNKIRNDIGISYQADVLRLIDAYRASGLYSSSVVITRYQATYQVETFKKKLNNLGINTYLHYQIDGYPQNTENILSDNGFGKNDYIPTTKKIVVVTAPGPGSGKMAVCLSQLYHEHKRNVKAGYAKYETFPIWNVDLNSPINLAYEAATADLADVNMIDPYHLAYYNKVAINYNRDVEIFPLLNSIFTSIYKEDIYHSPTDMGVNMAGFAITSQEEADDASKREIIRRYLEAKVDYRNGKISKDAVDKIGLIMEKLKISVDNRVCVKEALRKKEESNSESMALELPNKKLVSAKTSNLLSAPAALLLNSLKELAHINDDMDLISSHIIEPISQMKINSLHNHNPRLHADEILIALSISANTNPLAELAITKLKDLEGSEAHSTVILPEADLNVYKKLKINVTTEPESYAHKLYIKGRS